MHLNLSVKVSITGSRSPKSKSNSFKLASSSWGLYFLVKIPTWSTSRWQLSPHQCNIEGKDSLPWLWLMPPRMLLAFFIARVECWLIFNLVPTRTPRSFLLGCFPAEYLQHMLVPGAVPPQWRGSAFLPLELLWGSCLPNPTACQGPYEWQRHPLVYQPLLLVLCPLQTYWVESNLNFCFYFFIFFASYKAFRDIDP